MEEGDRWQHQENGRNTEQPHPRHTPRHHGLGMTGVLAVEVEEEIWSYLPYFAIKYALVASPVARTWLELHERVDGLKWSLKSYWYQVKKKKKKKVVGREAWGQKLKQNNLFTNLLCRQRLRL